MVSYIQGSNANINLYFVLDFSDEFHRNSSSSGCDPNDFCSGSHPMVNFSNGSYRNGSSSGCDLNDPNGKLR
ncbi:unnamed protein product [Rotaria sp. Silwood1]|nr:unnamed protein product [Rotaria sp. Silwood1]CAF1582559.1 unnamed protein product [Rotaria sp. Silwood1]CAF3666446.1 unnamed protein product [Rotaria sp. Silwood1]